MDQVFKLQQDIQQFRAQLDNISRMASQLAQSEQSNQSQLQQLAQNESAATQQLQRLQQVVQQVGNSLQEISGITQQISSQVRQAEAARQFQPQFQGQAYGAFPQNLGQQRPQGFYAGSWANPSVLAGQPLGAQQMQAGSAGAGSGYQSGGYLGSFQAQPIFQSGAQGMSSQGGIF